MGQRQSTLLDLLPAELRWELTRYLLTLEVEMHVRDKDVTIKIRDGFFSFSFTLEFDEIAYLGGGDPGVACYVDHDKFDLRRGRTPIHIDGVATVQISNEDVSKFIVEAIGWIDDEDDDEPHRVGRMVIKSTRDMTISTVIPGYDGAGYLGHMDPAHASYALLNHATLLRTHLSGWVPQFVPMKCSNYSALVPFAGVMVKTLLDDQ